MTDQLHTISNINPFATHRTESKDGREFLVVRGVPIVEGVLNNYFVSMDEFGAFTHDWNGVPLVLRHPKHNNGSARVPKPDVPVIGAFYGAMLDTSNRRLIGEYWFDKQLLLSTPEGEQIHNDILAGKVAETSTGYFAAIEQASGTLRGKSYVGIQKNIHPDHIAILPDEKGACSALDGCGVNRNSSVFANCAGCPCQKGNAMQANTTGDLPKQAKDLWESVYKKAKKDGDDEETAAKKAWGACKRAGWKKDGGEWVKQNYAILNADDMPDYSSNSMIAFMLPDQTRTAIREQFPFITDDVFNSLHLTLAFLGDTSDVSMVNALKGIFDVAEYQPIVKGQLQGLARFISGGEQDAIVLTFDAKDMPDLYQRLSGALNWQNVPRPTEHGFIPHVTIAYIGKDDPMPADTFQPIDMTITDIALVNGNETFLRVELGNRAEHPLAQNHYGPGPHKSGSSQDVHRRGGTTSSHKEIAKKLKEIRTAGGVLGKRANQLGTLTRSELETEAALYSGKKKSSFAEWTDDELISLTLMIEYGEPEKFGYKKPDWMVKNNTNANWDELYKAAQNANALFSLSFNSQATDQPKHWFDKLISNFTKEKQMSNFKDLVKSILNTAGYGVTFDDEGKTATATPNAAPLSETLTGLESVVNEHGGAEEFGKLLSALKGVPDQIRELSESLSGITASVKAAETVAQNAAQQAEARKKDIVARLIANAQCPFDEATLNGLALDVLEKLELSYKPTNYAALGAFVPQHNREAGDEVLPLPSFQGE